MQTGTMSGSVIVSFDFRQVQGPVTPLEGHMASVGMQVPTQHFHPSMQLHSSFIPPSVVQDSATGMHLP